jgi:glutamyl/glutaminyl-tRNA synthetase
MAGEFLGRLCAPPHGWLPVKCDRPSAKQPHKFVSCTMQQMVTRLAPTPSGYLHAGNVYNFLLNWLWARANGGKVLLRIDDADAARKRPEYVEDIFMVLDWLELDWDIGPTGPADFEKNWSQSQRTDLYDAVLEELVCKEMLFACTCTRSQLGTGPYPGHCNSKGLSLDTPDAAWRIHSNEGAIAAFDDVAMNDVYINLAESTGSFVVRKKDGVAAYQLTSLADDRHFGVTHIARGQDLLPSTAMQLYIDGLLATPHLRQCQFWHHGLLTNDSGYKLSKSAGHQSQGLMATMDRTVLLNGFAQWMGWPPGMDLDGMAMAMENRPDPTKLL